MKAIILLAISILLCSVPINSFLGRSRSGSSSGSRTSFGSRRTYGSSNVGWNIPSRRTSSYYGSRLRTSSSFTHKTGLSGTAKAALFGAGGALAGLYIGSKLRSSSYYGGMRNDNRFQVCPGQYIDAYNTPGTTHFVCPPDPDHFALNSCCYDGSIGYCCDQGYSNYGRTVGSSVSGAIGSIIMFVLFGLCIYFCCCRKKSDQNQVPVEMQEPEDDHPPEPQFPGEKSYPDYPPQPSYPPQPPSYPSAQPPAYPSQVPAYPPQAPYPPPPSGAGQAYPTAPGWN